MGAADADAAVSVAEAFRKRLGLADGAERTDEPSVFSMLRWEIRRERDRVWSRILQRDTSTERTNAQLIFDLCADLSEACPLLQERRVAFLLDDYSNQRIPVELSTICLH